MVSFPGRDYGEASYREEGKEGFGNSNSLKLRLRLEFLKEDQCEFDLTEYDNTSEVAQRQRASKASRVLDLEQWCAYRVKKWDMLPTSIGHVCSQEST